MGVKYTGVMFEATYVENMMLRQDGNKKYVLHMCAYKTNKKLLTVSLRTHACNVKRANNAGVTTQTTDIQEDMQTNKQPTINTSTKTYIQTSIDITMQYLITR